MAIKYDVRSIKNAGGEGKERRYAHLFLREPLTLEDIASRIEAGNSLTSSDVKSALNALGELFVSELMNGQRFHLPGFGYFSIQAHLDASPEKEKITGKDIITTGINFKPEASVLERVQREISYERLNGAFNSEEYSEDEIIDKVKAYLHKKPFINRRDMEIYFGLRKGKARQWLKWLVENGVLQKEGAHNSPVYYLV